MAHSVERYIELLQLEIEYLQAVDRWPVRLGRLGLFTQTLARADPAGRGVD